MWKSNFQDKEISKPNHETIKTIDLKTSFKKDSNSVITPEILTTEFFIT